MVSMLLVVSGRRPTELFVGTTGHAYQETPKYDLEQLRQQRHKLEANMGRINGDSTAIKALLPVRATWELHCLKGTGEKSCACNF